MKNIKIKYSYFEVIIFLFFLFSIIPFIILSLCNHPLGIHEWDWITNLGGLLNNLSFIEIQAYYFYNVMGRFSSTFISSLTPYFYSIINYKIFFLINILLSAIIFFFFVKTFTGLKSNLKICAISSILWIMWISGISGIYDTLFMLTSVQTYLFGFYGFVVLLILWKMYFSGFRKKNIIKSLIIIFTIFCIGTNELTLFFTIALNILVVFQNYKILKKEKIFLFTFLILILLFVYIALFSPSNRIRYNAYNEDVNFLTLIFLSISSSVFNFFTWIINGNIIIGFLLIITLLLNENISVRNIFKINIKFYIFGLILMILFGNILLIFSTNGMSLAERFVDHLFIFFIIGVLLLLFILVAENRIAVKKFINKLDNSLMKFSLFFVFIFSSFGQGIFLDRSDNSKQNYFSIIKTSSNIGTAWLSILDETVFKYNQEMNKQYITLNKCKSDTCYVDKPKHVHKFLYFNKNDRRNNRTGDPYMGYFFNHNIKSVKYNYQKPLQQANQ